MKRHVILVQPPIQDYYLTKKRTIPYGLAAISASLAAAGFETRIIDGLATDKSKPIDTPDDFKHLAAFYGKKDLSLFSLFHEYRHFGYSFEHIATQIKKLQPMLIGISSLFTPYAQTALSLAVYIKKWLPDCKIVMGGHHPTVFPEKTLACDAVDLVIRGEGEIPMRILCEHLRDGKDLKNVPGIAYWKGNEFHVSKPYWTDDLNLLPLPATHQIHPTFYQRRKKSSTMVVSSRGCPMKCSYCCVSAASSYAGFRQRSVSHVLKEIKQYARNPDLGFIDFEDENLCLNKKWFISLFSKISDILRGRNVELRAMNGLFPPSIDQDVVKLMVDAGFKTLNLSLGSTCVEQLKRFSRPNILNAFENALILASKNGLECVSYIIAAAPGQTAQSSLKDLLYLAQKQTLVGLSIFYPAPGSKDFEFCRESDLLPETFSQMRSSALPLDNTTSRLESITLLRLSRIVNFMKQLIDETGTLPLPLPIENHPSFQKKVRRESSIALLAAFLDDGQIRGITPQGGVYLHHSDLRLTRKFIHALKTIQVKGIKQESMR